MVSGHFPVYVHHSLRHLVIPRPILVPMGTLTAAQRESFLSHGFVHLEQVVDLDLVRSWTDQMWIRLGYDPQDPSTWKEAKVHMPTLASVPVAQAAPVAAAAIAELCGGEDRILQPNWSDAFIANFHLGRGKSWVPPGPAADGWHKDGDFFRHFLDSPEQALLVIVLWSDVLPTGGATFIAPDSIPGIARYLADHPEGVSPQGDGGAYGGAFPFKDIIGSCRDFREATGRAGDVYLLHPFTLHASSYNALGLPRMITNPPVSLKEPMCFDRSNQEDYSLVELKTLRALGVDRYDFTATGSRERLIPTRVHRQKRMREEEEARLRDAQKR
jgi:hypothetical protein